MPTRHMFSHRIDMKLGNKFNNEKFGFSILDDTIEGDSFEIYLDANERWPKRGDLLHGQKIIIAIYPIQIKILFVFTVKTLIFFSIVYYLFF